MSEPASAELFQTRHIGPRPDQLAEMLSAVGAATLDA